MLVCLGHECADAADIPRQDAQTSEKIAPRAHLAPSPPVGRGGRHEHPLQHPAALDRAVQEVRVESGTQRRHLSLTHADISSTVWYKTSRESCPESLGFSPDEGSTLVSGRRRPFRLLHDPHLTPDSLVVCQTEIRDLSRMCIVLRGQDGVIEQARRQLEDLVPVWAVLDYTQTPTIERELLLAKLSILGPEYAQDQLSGSPTRAGSASLDAAVESQDNHHVPGFVPAETANEASSDKMAREAALARSFESAGEQSPLYPARQGGMTASEALIAKNLHLSAIKTLADQFGGRVVDVAESSCIVELTAKSSRVDAFLALMRPFGVLEAARSGECLDLHTFSVSIPPFRALTLSLGGNPPSYP